MANVPIKDGNGNLAYLKSTGTGTSDDPFIQTHVMGAGTSVIGATQDAGPSQSVVRNHVYQADGSSAFDITAAPTAGQKIVAVDILVSVETACKVTIQMESTQNVLAAYYLPANGSAQCSLRGYLKGDAADKKLQAKTSVASKIDVTAVYFSEA